jgi:tRNA pseudouridine38-40 synthase
MESSNSLKPAEVPSYHSIMRNIKLTIAYDGGNYFGWQKTTTGPSIEEALEQVLTKILQEPISLQAASRTDAGVHAHGQVVNFFTSKEPDLKRLLLSVNQLLSKDIVVHSLEEAPSTFHPTLDCVAKEYHYSICASPFQMPHHRCYSWHVPSLVEVGKMEEAAHLLKGEKNFKSLCNAKKNSRYSCHVRNVSVVEIIRLPEQRVLIKIIGDHFLYKMARNIAGLLTYVGRGKLEPGQIEFILASESRIQASMTAPAHGLSLHKVFYKQNHQYNSLNH